MGRVIRSPRAERDILQAARYIAKENRDAALRFFTVIDEKFDLLARFPGAGPARPELGSALRSFPVWNYLIIYRQIQDGVEILAVPHGAQNLPRKLKNLAE
jgi:toxin ParE1/3/4